MVMRVERMFDADEQVLLEKNVLIQKNRKKGARSLKKLKRM